MQIQLSEDLAIEIEAIAAIAGCSASVVVTAILCRGYETIENEARRLRAIDLWDAKRTSIRENKNEPLPQHWRCSLGLD